MKIIAWYLHQTEFDRTTVKIEKIITFSHEIPSMTLQSKQTRFAVTTKRHVIIYVVKGKLQELHNQYSATIRYSA